MMGDAEAMQAFNDAQNKEGFFGHSFNPCDMKNREITCIWEAKKGKTAEDMQDFIDNSKNSPSMGAFNNEIKEIDRQLSGNVMPFAARFDDQGCLIPAGTFTAVNYRGKCHVSMILTVNKEQEQTTDAMWKRHAEWMAKTHAKEGDTELLNYTLSKAEQLSDEMNIESEKNGKIAYILSEYYAKPDGLRDHWKQASETGGEILGTLTDLLKEDGASVTMQNFGDVRHCGWLDHRNRTNLNSSTQVTMILTVNKDQEQTTDAMWKRHAEWMSKTHAKEGDTELLHYTVAKANQLSDEMNIESEKNGKIAYILNEVYAKPDGLRDHWKQASETGGEILGTLTDLLKKDGASVTMQNFGDVRHSLCWGAEKLHALQDKTCNTSKFYLVEHHFRAGKAEEWWKTLNSVMADSVKFGEWTSANKERGFFNHAFMPCEKTGTFAYCIWEARSDKTSDDFVAFIDGENGPGFGCCNNNVREVSIELCGGMSSHKPVFPQQDHEKMKMNAMQEAAKLARKESRGVLGSIGNMLGLGFSSSSKNLGKKAKKAQKQLQKKASGAELALENAEDIVNENTVSAN